MQDQYGTRFLQSNIAKAVINNLPDILDEDVGPYILSRL
jgi:hypothetical protein